ncbi:MoxR-like ATPase [Psychrobacter luti]|uniref:MoxR-like ATPase n=1 Tax=Psychrobacter luti TaxID=198481 RepID=A0A839TD67_9GAMM|nr:AAA family ATPase [Psychrobacter luti]MBB3107381.1 MoxR-like ATPase [Psychrobacter luti]
MISQNQSNYINKNNVDISVMIYEVKSPPVVQANYQKLFSSDHKHFYWNRDKFAKLKEGDRVFVVNVTTRTILNCFVEKLSIPTEYDDQLDQSSFSDKGEVYKVAGQWNEFICLAIKDEKLVDEEWSWKTLGSGEHTYILGAHVSFSSAVNKVQRIEQLLEVFKDDSKEEELLQHCLEIFKEQVDIPLAKDNSEQPDNDGQQHDLTLFSKQTQEASSSWLPKVQSYIASRGFDYSLADIANFYLSMRTKPLVILAGISGTGKTQLVRQFAKAIGYGDERHCVLIPVRPDWADNSDLIGYKNIQGRFEQQKLLKVLQDALAHPEEIFFVILDEMNLARVEHYFSDFLSVLETRERNNEGVIVTNAILTDDTVNQGIPVSIPQNLMIVGTVNMDETTHPFSRKVLDRANAIEMNHINLHWDLNEIKRTNPVTEVYADAFVSPYLNSIELDSNQKVELEPIIDLLESINEVLEPAGLHFGYRVRDELAFYLCQHKQMKLHDKLIMTDDQALDYQLMQKVLPRIQGSSISVLTALLKLLNQLSGAKIEENMELPAVEKAIKEVSGKLRFPLSINKLLFMLRRFNDDGFTSFWL